MTAVGEQAWVVALSDDYSAHLWRSKLNLLGKERERVT